MSKKKKDDNIAAKLMNDMISNGNTVPFRVPNDHFSFGDGYDDIDDGYDDEYYDSEESNVNGVELCIQSVEALGEFLPERDKEKIIDKIKANVNGRLRKLADLEVGDAIFIHDSPDDEDGEEYLVLMIGMYCDCCGERYRDSRDGSFIDEKSEPSIATLGDWTLYGLSSNGAVAAFTFDQIIYKGFEIRDTSYPELGNAINKWIGRE